MLAWLLAITASLAMTGAARAGCFPIAQAEPRPMPASFAQAPLPSDATLRLTFLGHASFLLETRGGVSAVTDYNGVHKAPFAPRLVTMNNAHGTHWTHQIEPGVEIVLRGWDPLGGLAEHDVVVDDLRVRNVVTSVRGRPDAMANSNSMFVFEVEDLCVAHLGHLHHALEDYHLAELGIIDIALVPVDGMWTMPQETAVQVIEQLRPSVVVPMHYFSPRLVETFVGRLGPEWTVEWPESPTWSVSRATLPFRHVLVLPGS